MLLSCGEPQYSKINIVYYNIKAEYDTLSRNLNIKSNIEMNVLSQNSSKINLLFLGLAKISKIQFTYKNIDYPIYYNIEEDSIRLNIPTAETPSNEGDFSYYFSGCSVVALCLYAGGGIHYWTPSG